MWDRAAGVSQNLFVQNFSPHADSFCDYVVLCLLSGTHREQTDFSVNTPAKNAA